MSNDQFRLQSLRRKWGLSQKELAALLPSSNRDRVSDVERGVIPPNASEILAYELIFGLSAATLFTAFVTETEDAVARNLYRFHTALVNENSVVTRSKREIIERIWRRVAGTHNTATP